MNQRDKVVISSDPNKKKKMAYALLPLLLLSICHCSVHGAPPPASAPKGGPAGRFIPLLPPGSAAEQFLAAHNRARAAVGVGPLKWSEVLANATDRVVKYQKDKMGCKFADVSRSKYGSNQMWSGGEVAMSPWKVVNDWVKEKNYYNYEKNSCEADQRCGLYKQVVWNKSLELGCAQALCAKERTSLTVCFYNPPGNMNGERPY
ncbi:hypothetical protein Tsubulata_004811 [Turnera subulata]|uniref:SCP domain-containing protein n=1 Tax=Turnera subulata TaxID=218843 RepID=A0A9Q0J4B5_9ROSI|nr:hypothetical protein Tsubulata_004811 [Turnera subulata]